MAISLSNEERAEVHKAFLEIDKVRNMVNMSCGVTVRGCNFRRLMTDPCMVLFFRYTYMCLVDFFMVHVCIPSISYLPYMDPMGLKL